jgi:23S rRNA (cytidine1920-2'-O)/16S rRNA (cytidine1409-2'-O)-methyltransferase
MAGQVRADGEVVLKPSTLLLPEARLEVDQGPPFVSRGGEKLLAALRTFDVEVADKVCADVGASSGGFTDCLLQHGARRVYAIDVGKGLLHWKLRQDPRVVVMEGVNARYLERLPEAVHLVTVDVSFISLKVLLPVIKGWLPTVDAGGEVLALVKPQFEAGRAEAARGEGVIRDAAVHRRVLLDVLNFAQGEGYEVRGLMRSPLLGPKGNVEFLAWLVYPGAQPRPLPEMIEVAVRSG